MPASKPTQISELSCPHCGGRLFAEAKMEPWEGWEIAGTQLIAPATILNFRPREADLLRLMIKAKGTPLHRSKVFDFFYSGRASCDVPEDDKIIDVFVVALRKKLAKAGLPTAIGTLWGVGYQLNTVSKSRGEPKFWPQAQVAESARRRHW